MPVAIEVPSAAQVDDHAHYAAPQDPSHHHDSHTAAAAMDPHQAQASYDAQQALLAAFGGMEGLQAAMPGIDPSSLAVVDPAQLAAIDPAQLAALYGGTLQPIAVEGAAELGHHQGQHLDQGIKAEQGLPPPQ